jgi:hypothetical protein
MRVGDIHPQLEKLNRVTAADTFAVLCLPPNAPNKKEKNL